MTTAPPIPGRVSARLSTLWAGAGDRVRAVPWAEVWLVLAGYTLLAIVVTWPLLLNFESEIPGGSNAGDASGYVWDLWNHAQNGLPLFGAADQDLVGAPFGRTIPGSANILLIVSLGPGWVIAQIASPIVAYNVIVMSGLVLSGAAMYLLIRWLGLGRASAAWAGLALAVSPYMVLRASVHIPFVHLWAFPLLVIAAVRWLQRPGWGRAGWLAGAIALAWLANPYYGVMALIAGVPLAVLGLALFARRGPVQGALGRVGQLAAVVGALVIVPLLLLLASSRTAVEGTFTRQRVELVLYGARVSDYVTPLTSDSLFTAIFGESVWAGWGSPGGERVAFIGFTTIALVGVAAFFLARDWTGTPSRQRLAVLLVAVCVPVLLLFSLQSPYQTYFGLEIPMPSSVVFDFAPFLRAYARFGVGILILLLVVAAIGLSRLLGRQRSTAVAASIAVVVFAVTVVDVSDSWPDRLALDSSPPVTIDGVVAEDRESWRWLADNADSEAIVLETPGDAREDLDRFWMYGQIVHGRDILNGTAVGAPLAQAAQKEVGTPTWTDSAARLATLGVDYVTVNPWAYAIVGRPAPDAQNPPPGYALAAVFPDGSAVWEVVAEPLDGIAIRGDGFWDPENVDNEPVRWLNADGEVAVIAGESGMHRIAFDAIGLIPGARYQVQVTGPDGTVEQFSVRDEGRVSFDLPLEEGRNDLNVKLLTPAAQQISPQDLRVASVRTTPWEVSRSSARS